MKIIDEKGRLFGKINVIDFLVLVFLFCFIPIFYFGYKIFAKEPKMQMPIKKEFVEIETDCQLIKLNPELLEIISIGDKELNEKGEVIGEIIDLGQSEPYKYKLDIGKGQKIIQSDAFLKQIKTKFRLKIKIENNNLIFYKNTELKLDLPFEFRTDKYKVIAIPIPSKEKIETVSAILKVKYSNLLPELAEMIKPEDKEIEVIEADADLRREVAKVVRIVSNQPSEIISLMEDGKNWNIVGHPKHKDVILEIEMLCVRKAGGLFKKNTPIKIGNPFVFTTDLYSISGKIIGLKIK